MPVYTFKDLTTGKEYDEVMSYEDMLKHKKKKSRKYNLTRKPIANVYTALVGGLLIYIIYKLVKRK